MAITINSALDPKALAGEFKAASRAQIANFLEPSDAERVYGMAAACQAFKFKYNDGPNEVFVKPLELKEMTDRRLGELGNRIFNAAMAGQYQYAHYACPLGETALADNRKLSPFKEVTDFLSGKEVKTFLKAVTGLDAKTATAEVQWHKTDCFQTTGDGRKRGEKRVFGYSLDLTRDWDPDFGAVRLFKTPGGEVEEVFTPKFNALTLFKVPMEQSISYVTGYAKGIKLSISGWFLAA